MFCSVIGCFNSADDGHIMKLLPKDHSKMNIWLKFVRLRPLVLSQDNQICEHHYTKNLSYVENVLGDAFRFKIDDTQIDNPVNTNSDNFFKESNNFDDHYNDNRDIDNLVFCRLCGTSKCKNMKDLFSSENTFTSEFHNFIKNYLNIQISDETFFTKKICSNCIKRINIIVAYKQKCDQANSILVQLNDIHIETNLNNSNAEDDTNFQNEDNEYEFEFLNQNDDSNSSYEKFTTEPIVDTFSDTEEKQEIEDDNTNFKHECSHCHRFLRTKEAKRVHAQYCRRGLPYVGDSKYKKACPICNQKVMSLRRHIILHDSEKKFSCKICNNRFYVMNSLREHMETHNEKTLKCPECNELFSGPLHLRRHRKRHNEAAKKHMCDICSKKFLKPVELRVHIGTVHNGEKAFKCNDCDEGFNYRHSLNRHAEKVHNKNIKVDRSNRISKYCKLDI